MRPGRGRIRMWVAMMLIDLLGKRQDPTPLARCAGCDPARWPQGQRVLRKGAGGVAVHIARELVQHQDFCQTALGRGAPRKQFTAGCGFQRGAEAGADGFVEGSVFDEVLLGSEFGEPKVQDGAWCGLRHGEVRKWRRLLVARRRQWQQLEGDTQRSRRCGTGGGPTGLA